MRNQNTFLIFNFRKKNSKILKKLLKRQNNVLKHAKKAEMYNSFKIKRSTFRGMGLA